jgi:hypothetical protein
VYLCQCLAETFVGETLTGSAPPGTTGEIERRVLHDRGEEDVLGQGEIESGHAVILSAMPACVFF